MKTCFRLQKISSERWTEHFSPWHGRTGWDQHFEQQNPTGCHPNFPQNARSWGCPVWVCLVSLVRGLPGLLWLWSFPSQSAQECNQWPTDGRGSARKWCQVACAGEIYHLRLLPPVGFWETQFSLGPCSPQDAVDISLWSVRHRCIVEAKMQGAGAFLAWFLSEPFSCKEILLEVGAFRFIWCNKLIWRFQVHKSHAKRIRSDWNSCQSFGKSMGRAIFSCCLQVWTLGSLVSPLVTSTWTSQKHQFFSTLMTNDPLFLNPVTTRNPWLCEGQLIELGHGGLALISGHATLMMFCLIFFGERCNHFFFVLQNLQSHSITNVWWDSKFKTRLERQCLVIHEVNMDLNSWFNKNCFMPGVLNLTAQDISALDS